MKMSFGGIKREDISRIPETINFPEEEERILNFWRDEKIFENCLKQSKGKPRYTFYDGPPFATGLPHYGHILAGTIKDVITRYAHQQGYHVERRFGWDCHGLPVEYEIDKTLNIRGPEDVAKMGIAAYNNECRKIVMRYAREWEEIVGRMGRWIDFRNDYKTLYPWYMETIWWVFKQLFEKGLVYQGVKVMPYSTSCTTALSNFESGQNYKEVVDPAVTVALTILPSSRHSDAQLLIWTTTPWTLPSNLSVCVNPTMAYVKIKEYATGKLYILAESRLPYVFKLSDDYDIVGRFDGKSLANIKYVPIFPYFKDYGERMNGFRVLNDNYVTDDSGTGIVHQAPFFGEDDFRVCLTAGIIAKDGEIICPVDDTGRFTEHVTDFVGQYVKDADKNIIATLKRNGALFQLSQIKHNYPFCWRSDTPLLYKAVPSWFIRVEHMSKNLLACSSQTYWVPDFVKEKRFGNWLKEARDWAISRNRYWGTPIPIWISPDGEEIICIGSIQELEKLSGQKITDLHRESIDFIEIPSVRPGRPPLKRIKEVFDCWFESGSMPFAQQHYPFENEKDFTSCFPADFIAEGIDQTRGWFYTLLVISTALFNKPPFKNLIANGLVLAADGQKMSKRKKNYPDPMEVVNKYGADALRLYLINSPVVRAENLRFKEEGVRDIIKDVFLPWYNAYRFLIQNITRLETVENFQYNYDRDRHTESIQTATVMDVWILSFKESLLEFVSTEMKAYRLYTVVPKLTKFIDQLTNWYVRLNRRRIKGEMGNIECIQSIDTLYDVLLSMVKMMAPFTPFLSEYIYQHLNLLTINDMKNSSVHYQMMPIANRRFIRKDVEIAVSRMQNVIELGRIIRDRRTLPVKYPVQEIIVIHKDQTYLNDITRLKDFILGELNVRKLTITADKEKYGISLRAEPDHKLLGQRLKGDFKAVMAAIKNLTDIEIQSSLEKKQFKIMGHDIDLTEVRIIYCFSKKLGADFEAHSDNDVLVLVDATPNDELIEEGIRREIINRIQKLKKKAQLIPTDPVLIYYTVNQANHIVRKVASTHKDLIESAVKSSFNEFNQTIRKPIIIDESFDLKGVELKIIICSTDDNYVGQLATPNIVPVVSWLNVILDDSIVPRYGNGQRRATIVLQKPSGKLLTFAELCNEIELIFGLYQTKYIVVGLQTLAAINNVTEQLKCKTVIVTKSRDSMKSPAIDNSEYERPFKKFKNFELNQTSFTVFENNPNCHLDIIVKKIQNSCNN